MAVRRDEEIYEVLDDGVDIDVIVQAGGGVEGTPESLGLVTAQAFPAFFEERVDRGDENERYHG